MLNTLIKENKITKEENIWLLFMKPFRELPQFKQIKNRDLQTIKIMLEIFKVPFIVESIKEKEKE